MAMNPIEHSRAHWRRLTFMLLVAIPFLPEIVMGGTAALAALSGCKPDQDKVCLIGAVPVSDVIAFALQSAAGWVRLSYAWHVAMYAVLAVWIVVCYVALTRGWARLRSRLLLGFAVALIFAFLPYFAPMLTLDALAHGQCHANEAYVGACKIFGGEVGAPAHDAVRLGWGFLYGGALLAPAIFVVYAIIVIAFHRVSAKRPVTST
jgi:hypothetical protein